MMQLLAIAAGGLAAAGITLGAISSLDKDESIDDKVNTTLVRVGYTAEGILMGSIVAIPTSLLILVTFETIMRLKKKAGV
ncbi:MAG: hypothetical protein GY777_27805 [Candidatus Brocadiaceae bacterium]|nr:hypothetical protein [Candidatus Brocadiaceae bacterium]